MNNEPLISVIVPCYNVQEYLIQCVESIRNQTYSHLEIILVDDGSTDKTPEICDELAQSDKRIIVLHKCNGGLSQARNSGLELATGEYILFLDSDDWLDSEACENALQLAQEYDLDVVLWSYVREFASGPKPKLILGDTEQLFDQEGVKKLHRRIIGLTGEELTFPEHADSLVTAWGKLYRRQTIQHICFVDTSEIGTEDAYFNILVFGNVKSAAYIPQCYNHYRKTNEKSLSTAYTRKIFERWKNLYIKIQNYLDENNLPDSYYDALRNRICFGIIGLGTNLAQSGESIRHILSELNAVLSDPVYRDAINRLEFRYLPIKWKVFFCFAKKSYALFLYLMLCAINFMRKA